MKADYKTRVVLLIIRMHIAKQVAVFLPIITTIQVQVATSMVDYT
jgi:hypothetical protein